MILNRQVNFYDKTKRYLEVCRDTFEKIFRDI